LALRAQGSGLKVSVLGFRVSTDRIKGSRIESLEFRVGCDWL
jgi:hypothetical protein